MTYGLCYEKQELNDHSVNVSDHLFRNSIKLTTAVSAIH